MSKKLNVFDATMLVMGGIIGVGIFFSPHGVAEHAPDATMFLLLWVCGGVVAMCGAFTFAEWGGSIPRAGGWFVFLREVFPPIVAFLFAWVVLGVISTGAIAVIASFGAEGIGTLTGLTGKEGSVSHRNLAAGFVVLLTGAALLGAKVGATVQDICMVAKLVAILALIGAAIAYVAPASTGPVPAFPTTGGATTADVTIGSVSTAALSVFFAYGGWQHLCYIAPQVKDPERTLPKAIVIGVLGVALIYVATNFGYLRVLGIDGLVAHKDVAATTAQKALGGGMTRALAAAMAISALGVCTVNILVTPGIYVAMARERLFFSSFGRLNAKTGAPVLALLLQCVLSLGYLQWNFVGSQPQAANDDSLRMNLSTLMESVVFAEWIFHGLVAWGLLSLRRRRPDLPRPFRMPLWPLPVWIYLGVALFLVSGNLAETFHKGRMDQTLLGLAVLAVGATIYLPWRAFFGKSHRVT